MAIFTAIAGIKRNRFLAVGLLVVVALGCLAAGNILRKRGASSIVSPQGLYVSEEDLDLGEMFFSENPVEHSFTVHNPTEHQITIKGWRTSCNCSTITPNEVAIPAHGKETFKGRFTIQKDKDPESKSYVASFLCEPVILIEQQKEGAANHVWQFSKKIVRRYHGPSTIFLRNRILSDVVNNGLSFSIPAPEKYNLYHVTCHQPQVVSCKHELANSHYDLKMSFSNIQFGLLSVPMTLHFRSKIFHDDVFSERIELRIMLKTEIVVFTNLSYRHLDSNWAVVDIVVYSHDSNRLPSVIFYIEDIYGIAIQNESNSATAIVDLTSSCRIYAECVAYSGERKNYELHEILLSGAQ